MVSCATRSRAVIHKNAKRRIYMRDGAFDTNGLFETYERKEQKYKQFGGATFDKNAWR